MSETPPEDNLQVAENQEAATANDEPAVAGKMSPDVVITHEVGEPVESKPDDDSVADKTDCDPESDDPVENASKDA
jgi:hypothetical protein